MRVVNGYREGSGRESCKRVSPNGYRLIKRVSPEKDSAAAGLRNGFAGFGALTVSLPRGCWAAGFRDPNVEAKSVETARAWRRILPWCSWHQALVASWWRLLAPSPSPRPWSPVSTREARGDLEPVRLQTSSWFSRVRQQVRLQRFQAAQPAAMGPGVSQPRRDLRSSRGQPGLSRADSQKAVSRYPLCNSVLPSLAS